MDLKAGKVYIRDPAPRLPNGKSGRDITTASATFCAAGLELEDDGAVVGSVEALEPRWWAFRILLGYLRRFAQGEPLPFPIDLADLGDPAVATQLGD